MDGRQQQKLLEAGDVDDLHTPVQVTPPQTPIPRKRKTAAQRLLESEARARALVAATGQIIWTAKANGLIKADVPGWRAYTGQSEQQIKGWGWLEAIHPEDREQTSRRWKEAIAAGRIFETEYRLRRADGEYRIFLARGVPVLDEDGRIREWVGSCTDITERRRAELELSQTREMLATQLDDMTRLHEFSTRLTSNIELKRVLEEALISVITMQGTHMGTVMLYDSNRGILRMAASVGFNQEYLNILGTIPPGVGACGTALKERRSVLIEDVELEESFKPYLPLAARAGYRAAYSVPLFSQSGAVMGTIGTYFPYPHRPSPREARLVELYARQVAHAVENAQTYQKTRTALTSLLEMVQELMSLPYEPAWSSQHLLSMTQSVARRLAEQTRATLGCERVAMLSLGHAADTFYPLTIVGLAAAQEDQWWRDMQSLQTSAFDAADVRRLCNGQVILIDTMQPPYLERWSSYRETYGARRLLVAPVCSGERLLGILMLDHGEAEHTLSPEETILAGTVAKLVGLVIAHERLRYDWAKAHASELALREITHHMDDFLSMTTHELRSPITTIRGNLQLARRQLTQLLSSANGPGADMRRAHEALRDQFILIERHTARLNRRVEDLLDVSRIQTGNLTVRLEPVDLLGIVREAIEEVSQSLPRRVIHLHADDEQCMLVRADAERIGQVVTNYLTNALKYSPGDRPVDVGVETQGQQARVWVRDQGPGLSPSEQERIWARFQRIAGREGRRDMGAGLGLGLYICRGIIEHHHGQVGVESAQGKGATFWFTLPLATPQ